MNNYINSRKSSWMLIILIMSISLIFSGCGQGPEEKEKPTPEQQSAEDSEKEDKPPEQLSKIEESIESIFKALDGPAVVDEDEKGQDENKHEQQGQQEQQGQGGQDKQKEGQQNGEQKSKEEGSQEEGGQEGGQDKKKDQQSQQQPQQEDPWQEITGTINNLHYTWNSYMPMAAKKGASGGQIENFSNALNNLTSIIIGKNKANTLLAASAVYAYVPDFYSLYRTKNSPEIKKIRHHTRNAILNAMTANWAQAAIDMSNLESTWSFFKNAVGKEQQEDSNKLDFSIKELDKVINEKNQPLADIKGRVALSNTQALEKAMEKESGQQGGSSQE